MNDLKTRASPIRVESERIKADIESFNTQEGQQLNLMKRHFPEVATGWEWIQEHQSEFEKEIMGPPMITCSIKDERFSDQVQAMLQMEDFTCFTTQTKADFKKLSNELFRNMSLSVNVRTCDKPLESFRPPVSQEQAAGFGLDGFALDFLDGPSPVLAMLCAEKNLHRSGISQREHSDAQYEALVQSGTINQWAAGRQSYVVRRRREYGPQAMTAVAKPVHPGKFWNSQPVDTQEKVELERRLETLNHERQALKAEHGGMGDQKEELEKKVEEAREKVVSVSSSLGSDTSDLVDESRLTQCTESTQNREEWPSEGLSEVAVDSRQDRRVDVPCSYRFYQSLTRSLQLPRRGTRQTSKMLCEMCART